MLNSFLFKELMLHELRWCLGNWIGRDLFRGGGAGVSFSVSISPFVSVSVSLNITTDLGDFMYSVCLNQPQTLFSLMSRLFDGAGAWVWGLQGLCPLHTLVTPPSLPGPMWLNRVLCLCPVFGPLCPSQLPSKSTVPYFKKFKT